MEITHEKTTKRFFRTRSRPNTWKWKDFSKIFNEDGLFKKLTKRIVERALNTEMDAYLGYEKYNRKTDENNYRNGTSSKTI
ncbi:transposase, partial [Williamsoniiplasma lucivorax]|uniref:transposase n=1 Tax=Williamsoniiplasma lucivorax TaxID=209274 RepID=UPI001B7F98C0